jgi:ABC-type transporter Mla MlaB component
LLRIIAHLAVGNTTREQVMKEERIEIGRDCRISEVAEIGTQIRTVLDAAKTKAVVVDCAHMGTVDTAGIQLLIMASRLGKAQNKPVRFADVPEGIWSVIQILGLEGEFAGADRQGA